jgi:hypothetical protein
MLLFSNLLSTSIWVISSISNRCNSVRCLAQTIQLITFGPRVAHQVFNQQRQNYDGQRNGGCTRGRSQGGRGRPSRTLAAGGTIVPYVPPTLPGTIPFISPGIPPML